MNALITVVDKHLRFELWTSNEIIIMKKKNHNFK